MREVLIRKTDNTLVVAGGGIQLLALWGLLKGLMLLFEEHDESVQMLSEENVGIVLRSADLVVYIYCAGLCYAGIMRMISAFRRTAIVFIQ